MGVLSGRRRRPVEWVNEWADMKLGLVVWCLLSVVSEAVCFLESMRS